jgi:serine/threonine protein kinase
LLSSHGVAKIADFGFTSVGESGQQYSSVQQRMTPNYSSPELIIYGKYSKKSDIWAMGCILYEVCFVPHHRRKAFATLPAITSYYYNESLPPPQIGWDDFGSSANAIPDRYKEHKVAVEQRWDGLNIIFAAVFRRKPEERPTALELRDNLQLISDGNKPTLPDYRPNRDEGIVVE